MSKIIFSVAGGVLLLGGGCASKQSQVEDTEQMLAAAGFEEKPASTPERQQQISSLPPYKLLRRELPSKNTSFGYVYADPQFCHCIFVGGPKEYQAYQQAALQKRVAEEQLQAAEMQQDAAFNWGMWGPYGGWWGPGPW
jgi:hypothetical protein